MTNRRSVTDILCIGCQKGSTSWLHSVLNCHPRTWAFENRDPVTSTDKEAHFWDWNHHRGLEWYRGLMTPPDAGLWSMDFTPEYALMDDAQIAECRQINPTARVIYILRDPLARAVSTMRMFMLWNQGVEDRSALQLGEIFEKYVRNSKLAQHSDYLRNLRAWQKHFPDLILLNYEDFHINRRQNMVALIERLGLDMAEMQGDDLAQFDHMMQERVWKSEAYDIDRAALMTLHGMTWQARVACETELGLRFAEGRKVLGLDDR